MTTKKKPAPSADDAVSAQATGITLSLHQQLALSEENKYMLNAQVEYLKGRVANLVAENATLRETVEALTPAGN